MKANASPRYLCVAGTDQRKGRQQRRGNSSAPNTHTEPAAHSLRLRICLARSSPALSSSKASSAHLAAEAMEQVGPRGPPIIPRQEPDSENVFLSKRNYKRYKVGTRLFLGTFAVGLLLYDWDSYLGTDNHVFSGVRPALRRALDWVYGVEAPPRSGPPSSAAQRP